MKKILILAFLSFSITMLSQNGTIKGSVIDSETKEALIGVNLIIKGTTSGTSTDIDGNYELSVPTGPQTIIFSYVSYKDKSIEVNLSEGEVKVLDVLLGEDEDVNILTTVVVSATKFEQKMSEQTVSIDVMKPVFLERQNLTDISQAVQKNPGVTVIDGQANIRGGSGYSYGAGSRVLLLLDDLPILQADAGFPSWTSIPLENIGQIEIIKGAASALYGSSAMNGIINVRTAYPTSTPLTKISVFGGLWNAPNKNDYSYDINSEKIIKSETDKAWWKQDKLILQKGDLGSAEYDTIDISKSSPWPN